ncbi:MAG: 2-amino-4-hydroxy-6-hydroxymethyldihydropteridine diphosphokinase [Fimbriimonadia bacterium]
MARVFFSLGSNLGDSPAHLRYAIERIAREIGPILHVSSLYRTAPQGVSHQPDYLNAVVGCDTSLGPEEVLGRCLAIEAARGRIREFMPPSLAVEADACVGTGTSDASTASGGGIAPRTLDIDLLLYDDLQIETDSLCIPHPRMEQRSFVLTPLAEIEPNLILPSGASVCELLARDEIRAQRVERLGELAASFHPTY